MMTHETAVSRSTPRIAAGTLLFVLPLLVWTASGQEKPIVPGAAAANSAIEEAAFKEHVQSLLKKFCVRCHNPDNLESGIRVDHLTTSLEERQIPLWKGIQKQVLDGAMPPEDEPQPTAEQRKAFDGWVTRAITAVRSRPSPKNGSVRRLTVSQYRNTLRDLLGLEEDLTDALPPDDLSKDGFTNNGQTLLLSPLQVESYFDIAEKALDLCIVDENTKPVIQNFRMEFGASTNPQPCPDKLVLGANNALLKNEDFVVTELKPTKPFDFQPFAMKTKHEFIEGYVGNDTIREWKKFDSIYHSVFACVRGTPGYPKGEAYQVVPSGLLLRPAIPSPEIFGQSNTYGPMANFKISLRELPEQGNFRVTVKAARYDEGELDQRDKTFAKRSPSLGVYLGLRRDCGSTLTRVGEQRAVSNTELQDFVFEGAINDFPTPDVEKDNVNYLAGIREIGVRSEYTDGREMPRLLIRSIEFEGPFYDSWPPATHRKIFIESPRKNDPAAYAQEVIRSFATRAFRRPVTTAELESLVGVWKRSFADKAGSRIRENSDSGSNRPNSDEFGYTNNFRRSIKDALLVVLTSPQFLFLIENSSSPAAEDLDSYELASKLSYFLWNAPPDKRLLELAAKEGRSRIRESSDGSLTTSATENSALNQSLDAEIERMIRDPRFGQFINEFASQWLSLDKFDVVAVDAQRYPRLTRDTKTQLRQEPVQFLRYLIEQNLPLRNVIQSDFLVANEVTASYYNLADRTEDGFRFVPVQHENENLGGLLTQASILSGLSDGRESNPIKRGAWLARKIIAEPPDDPPPNVPQLKEEDGAKLTLREKLERHRNQKGCVKCHTGIDPWGIPFETFDAGGLFKKDPTVDARSTLPDKTEIKDLNGLKGYLANDRIDQVAFSFLKHAASYAVGRSLTYNELAFLQEQSIPLKANDYRMQELLRFVIKSHLFLKK